MAPVFIRLLVDAFDPLTMSFARYTCAVIPLVAISTVFFRPEFIRILRNLRMMLPLVTLNIFMQCAWVYGAYGSTANTAQLVTKISVIFVIVLSYFFFREERAVVRHPAFLLGTVGSLCGVAAVLTTDPATLRPAIDGAAMLLILTALCWAVYNVWAKHLVKNIHPIPLFTVLALYSTPILGVLSFIFGEPSDLLHITPRIAMITALAGLIPLSLCHPSFYFAQKELGAAYCNTFILFNPALTYVAALILLPSETLIWTQIAGALILMSGTFMVTIARRRTDKDDSDSEAIDASRPLPEQGEP